jgi:thioredoxin-disulfide reductase
MYDSIIIGGGPAGITAAIYAARKMMKFAVIYQEPGGEVAKTTYIENYTGYKNVTGEELTKIMLEHMKVFNPEIVVDTVKSVEKKDEHYIIHLDNRNIETKTVIIATGALPKQLMVPGEKEFASKGVSWCATCDAPLFAGRDVAVIGAGNTGLTSVIQLLDIANKVYLISKYAEPKADPMMVEKAKKNPKLEIVREGSTTSINGTKFVESINIKLKDGTTRNIAVQGVFINIGYQPNTTYLNGLVKLDNFGYIIVDNNNMTSQQGIFAAGDVTNIPYKQIIIAAGGGANAAIAAYDYIAKTNNE